MSEYAVSSIIRTTSVGEALEAVATDVIFNATTDLSGSQNTGVKRQMPIAFQSELQKRMKRRGDDTAGWEDDDHDIDGTLSPDVDRFNDMSQAAASGLDSAEEDFNSDNEDAQNWLQDFPDEKHAVEADTANNQQTFDGVSVSQKKSDYDYEATIETAGVVVFTVPKMETAATKKAVVSDISTRAGAQFRLMLWFCNMLVEERIKHYRVDEGLDMKLVSVYNGHMTFEEQQKSLKIKYRAAGDNFDSEPTVELARLLKAAAKAPINPAQRQDAEKFLSDTAPKPGMKRWGRRCWIFIDACHSDISFCKLVKRHMVRMNGPKYAPKSPWLRVPELRSSIGRICDMSTMLNEMRLALGWPQNMRHDDEIWQASTSVGVVHTMDFRVIFSPHNAIINANHILNIPPEVIQVSDPIDDPACYGSLIYKCNQYEVADSNANTDPDDPASVAGASLDGGAGRTQRRSASRSHSSPLPTARGADAIGDGDSDDDAGPTDFHKDVRGERIQLQTGVFSVRKGSRWVDISQYPQLLPQWVQNHPFDIADGHILMLRHFNLLCDEEEIPLYDSVTYAQQANGEQPQYSERLSRYANVVCLMDDVKKSKMLGPASSFSDRSIGNDNFLQNAFDEYNSRATNTSADELSADRNSAANLESRIASLQGATGEALGQEASFVFAESQGEDSGVITRGFYEVDWTRVRRQCCQIRNHVNAMLEHEANHFFRHTGHKNQMLTSELNNIVNTILCRNFCETLLIPSKMSDQRMGNFWQRFQDFYISDMNTSAWNSTERVMYGSYGNDGLNVNLYDQIYDSMMMGLDKVDQHHALHAQMWRLYLSCVNSARPEDADGTRTPLNVMMCGKSAVGKSFLMATLKKMTVPDVVMTAANMSDKALVTEGRFFHLGILEMDEAKSEAIISARKGGSGAGTVNPDGGTDTQNMWKQATDEHVEMTTFENMRGQPNTVGRPLGVSMCMAPACFIVATNAQPADVNPNLATRFTVTVVNKPETGTNVRAEFRTLGGMEAVTNRGENEVPSKLQSDNVHKAMQRIHWCTSFVQFLEACGAIDFGDAWSVSKDTVNMLAEEMKPYGKLDQRSKSRLYATARAHHLVMIVTAALFSSAGRASLRQQGLQQHFPARGLVGKHAAAWEIFQAIRRSTGPSQPNTICAVGAQLPVIYDYVAPLLGPYITKLWDQPRIKTALGGPLKDEDLQNWPFMRERQQQTAGSRAVDTSFGMPNMFANAGDTNSPEQYVFNFDKINTGKRMDEFSAAMQGKTGMSAYEIGKALAHLLNTRMSYPRRQGPVADMSGAICSESCHVIELANCPIRRCSVVVVQTHWVLESCKKLPNVNLVNVPDGKSLPSDYTKMQPEMMQREAFNIACAKVCQPDVPRNATMSDGGQVVTDSGTYYTLHSGLCINAVIERRKEKGQTLVPSSRKPRQSSFHRLTAQDNKTLFSLRSTGALESVGEDTRACAETIGNRIIAKSEKTVGNNAYHACRAHASAIQNGILAAHIKYTPTEDDTVEPEVSFQLVPPHPAASIQAINDAVLADQNKPSRYPQDFLQKDESGQTPVPHGNGWIRDSDQLTSSDSGLSAGYITMSASNAQTTIDIDTDFEQIT